MPPIKRKKPDHEYQVVWNPTRRTFDVERDGVRLGSFARDKNTAVGLAIKEAKLEAKLSAKLIVVSSMQDDRRIIEWTSL